MSNNIDIVILAAGIGSRLQPLTDDTPKCMIDVGSSTILDRILKQFGKNDEVDTISICTGFMHKKIAGFVSDNYSKVQCIYNEDYLNTNNMYSLYLYFNQRSNDNDLVVMNADCIYNDDIVEKCLRHSGSCIMTDENTFLEESMKVKVENQRVKGISKQYQQAKDVYTSIDLYKFDRETAKRLTKIVEGYIEDGDLNQWTEIAINDLLSENNHSVVANDIEGQRWFEIDTIEDLEKARELFS